MKKRPHRLLPCAPPHGHGPHCHRNCDIKNEEAHPRPTDRTHGNLDEVKMWPPFLLDSSSVSGGEEGRGTRSAPAGRRIAAFFMLLMLNLQSALGKLSILIGNVYFI